MENRMLSILAVAELASTGVKSMFLVKKGETRMWKVGVLICFLIESALGIFLSVWLVKALWPSADAPGHYSAIVIIFCAEVFAFVIESTIIRRKLLKLEAPESLTWSNILRQAIKYIAVACGLTSLVIYIVRDTSGLIYIYTGGSAEPGGVFTRGESLYIALISLLIIACVITIVFSLIARKRTILRAIFSSSILMFCQLSTIIMLYTVGTELSTDAPSLYLESAIGTAVLFAAAGTLLVVLSAWRIPDFKTEPDPDFANILVVETAAFGVGIPLFVIGLDQEKSLHSQIVFTILPQSMVIVGPILFALLLSLFKRNGNLDESPNLSV